MAKPVEHACFLFADIGINEGYVNVYRTPQGTTYGWPWANRDAAQKSSTHEAPSYLLHIKRKEQS